MKCTGLKAYFPYLCLLQFSSDGAAPLQPPPRLAATLRDDFCFFPTKCEARTVGGPGAAVFPRGTRCTASRQGMGGHSEEGKSLMALSTIADPGHAGVTGTAQPRGNLLVRMRVLFAQLLQVRGWLDTLAEYRGELIPLASQAVVI